jgi:glutaminyl-tRNA synthetase
MSEAEARPTNFIRQIIDEDLASGKHTTVHTRFPPEPNGYLHIGHAKSICLNFGIAQDYKGQCNLRFDDTNPVKEDIEYVESIKNDVEWLGFHWSGNVRYSSDYFDQLHAYAIELINKGLAYVDELTPEQIREYRGTLTQPGKNSPYRDRSVEENLALFEKMRAGGFEEGKACLRAKIDMASPFIVIRCCTVLNLLNTTRLATSGASTRCTTSPTASAMPWKVLRTLCVRLSSRTTAVCTTGYWTTSPFLFTRASTNSRA